MLAGAVASSTMRTAALLGVPAGLVSMAAPTPEILALGKAVLAASVALVAGVALAAKGLKVTECKLNSPPAAATWLERFTEVASGFLFALGLGVSGMTRPSRVSGFLSVFSGTFDPSLMFVMGGALLVAVPGFQLILRRGAVKQPLCTSQFNMPSLEVIDKRLLVGAALFGAGWGAAGICPGPGLVALATQTVPAAAFVGSMLVGMLLSPKVEAAVCPV